MLFELSTPAILRPDLALTGLSLLVGLAVVLYSSAVPQGRRGWWLSVALLVALVVAALQFEMPLARTLLLNLAVVAAIGMVWVDRYRELISLFAAAR